MTEVIKKKRKKGETKHHIAYQPEVVVVLPSKGVHRIINSFQAMKPTKQNIQYLDNVIKAIQFIKLEKESKLKNGNKRHTL